MWLRFTRIAGVAFFLWISFTLNPFFASLGEQPIFFFIFPAPARFLFFSGGYGDWNRWGRFQYYNCLCSHWSVGFKNSSSCSSLCIIKYLLQWLFLQKIPVLQTDAVRYICDQSLVLVHTFAVIAVWWESPNDVCS